MSRSNTRPLAPAAPAPRANPDLLGHATAELELRRLFDNQKLPHALLVCGPRGIGKATLGFRLARFLLATLAQEPPGLFGSDSAADQGLSIPAQSGVFRRVAAGGHADLLTVERAWDPRRHRMRSEIVVEDAREIGAFLRLTPAEGGWRVVVVDGADEMNRSAANALLKILEEPPQRALLVLVAHSPGRLLPTIRSRCRRLSLEPLEPDIVGELISRYRPDLGLAERAAIIALAGGSIGRALELAAVDGIELYRSILTLLSGRTGLDTPALHDFADRVARAEAAESYRTVEELIGHFLENLAMAAAGRNAELALPGEETILRRLSACAPAERWAALRHEIGANFARSNALNLDRKQSILSAFFAIERAAG